MAAVLPGFSAHWIAVEREGALVGGTPAMIERRASLHWIHAMPWGLSGAPLALPGLHAAVDSMVATAIDRRARELGAVGGEWVIYRPHGPRIEPETLERVPGETRDTSTSVIDLRAGVDEVLRGMRRKTRKQVRATDAPPLACAEEPGALEEAYALYRAQARRWRGHRPRPLELLRRLLIGGAPAGRLFTARDARGLLTAGVVLTSTREWMWWWSGSHPEARAPNALARLIWWSVERAVAEGGERINLGASSGLASVAMFKVGLGARDLPVAVRWMAPIHAGLVGRAVGALQARVRKRRARGAPA
jgi:hypothetical protein